MDHLFSTLLGATHEKDLHSKQFQQCTALQHLLHLYHVSQQKIIFPCCSCHAGEVHIRLFRTFVLAFS